MLKLNDKYIKLVNDSEKELSDIFSSIEENTFINSKKVLDAFHRENISESDLNGTSGYGYNDIGRDKIERIFSYVLDSEDALVRTQIISGTHAISTAVANTADGLAVASDVKSYVDSIKEWKQFD